jgi:hypothetical protein
MAVKSNTWASFKATFDCNIFYLSTPMTHKEYMRITIASFPQAIIEQYHLLDLVHKGFVLLEISRSIYGIPLAGILAREQLVKHMATHGYAPCTCDPGPVRSHAVPQCTAM